MGLRSPFLTVDSFNTSITSNDPGTVIFQGDLLVIFITLSLLSPDAADARSPTRLGNTSYGTKYIRKYGLLRRANIVDSNRGLVLLAMFMHGTGCVSCPSPLAPNRSRLYARFRFSDFPVRVCALGLGLFNDDFFF